jgi:hypothetical protein
LYNADVANAPPPPPKITYLVRRIEHPASAHDEVSAWLQERGDRGMLIALHACGKLTDDALGMFVAEEGLRAVVIVGCESGAASPFRECTHIDLACS